MPDETPGRPARLPAPVAAAAHALRGLPVAWAVAGGWAIDLALGRLTRPHADVDVAAFRDDQAALRSALAGWTFEAVAGGARAPWPAGVRLELPVHEVYAHPPAGGGPALEILLNERDGASWVYRRDAAVRRPLSLAIQAGPEGVPVLAPEIVLLYKSSATREADEHDFDVGRALLDAEARAWLRAAIARRAPDHPWAARLAAPH